MLCGLGNLALGQGDVVSPYEFGLREARTGEDRFRAIYQAHCAAIERGAEVCYRGIDTLWIDIPEDGHSIPLTKHTDFGGLVLMVRNNAKQITMFYLSGEAKPIAIDKSRLDGEDFSDFDELADGTKLLILNDKNPWVAERIGYGSPSMRRDILLLRDGHAVNRPVAAWNTPATEASCSYVEADDEEKTIAHLTMHRDKGSTFKTYCLSLSQQNNVRVEDVHVTTPKSKMLADGVFSISNCTNVTLVDVTVDGTYSKAGVSTGYGYAFSMNNDYNTLFRRVKADGNWGVFGTNCLSHTTLEHCDINRFDIHCYGRDARMVGCTFRNKQTQFSSMYGTVEFDSCEFIDCIPLRIRSSYNAYTPFDVVMKHCSFSPTRRYHALVNLMLLDTNDNKRPELKEKCIPNISISDMEIRMPLGLGKVVLLDPTGSVSECTSRTWGHMDKIRIERLRTVRNGRDTRTRLVLANRLIKTNAVSVELKDVELGGGEVTRNLTEK